MPNALLTKPLADGSEVTAADLGPIGHQSLFEIDLPRCPDCGGDLLWVEASHGIGARECAKCGVLFRLKIVN